MQRRLIYSLITQLRTDTWKCVYFLTTGHIKGCSKSVLYPKLTMANDRWGQYLFQPALSKCSHKASGLYTPSMSACTESCVVVLMQQVLSDAAWSSLCVCVCVCVVVCACFRVCICVCVCCVGVMLQSSVISLYKAVCVQLFSILQAKCSGANTVNYLSSRSFKILC